jgi:hypothetical protein
VPSTPPPSVPTEGAEYLEHGGGAPIPAPSRSLRRPVLLGGAVVGGLAVAGGAAWAAMAFLGTGEQPAQALPASTLGYLSVDLDPGGAQKIEAVRTLNKLPAFKEELGLETDDDLRRALFDALHGAEACAGLDYADDIEPWLGNRAAVAIVDDTPTIAVVVQVTDAEGARAGLTQLENCAASGDAATPASGDGDVGYAVEGDWAVVAESADVAASVLEDAGDSSLADDADFQTWSGRAGDPGILSVYAAPDAPSALFDSMGGLLPLAPLDPTGEGSATETPEEGLQKALDDFEGMAATLRFNDGAIELETAGSLGAQGTAMLGTDGGDDVLATLPADTAAAFGLGFADGWLTALADEMAGSLGGEVSSAELFEELSAQTGLEVPTDIETLMGESAALAVGGDFDAEQMMSSADGSDVPVGLKVQGDPAAIQGVLDTLLERLGPEASAVSAEADGDVIAIGPNDEYRTQLLEDGALGDSETFRDVIREAEQASAIFYLDFDAGNDWLATLAGDDAEVAANVEPLSALGVSAWSEDGVSHGVVRLTTD